MLQPEMRPMYVLRRTDTGLFADFLNSQLNHALEWKWVQTFDEARWLAPSLLPRLYYSPGGKLQPTITVPFPASTEEELILYGDFHKVHIVLFEVHPGFWLPGSRPTPEQGKKEAQE